MAQSKMNSTTALHYTSIEDIPRIRDRLRYAFRSNQSHPLQYRKDQLLQLGYLFENNASRFADAFLADLGRPPLETAFLEVNAIIGDCADAYKNLDKWAKPQGIPFIVPFAVMRPKIYKQPKGVALVIGPFNFPILCSMGPLVGAIAAGCACVAKLSELVPTVSSLIAELWPSYMDENMYQVVNGGIAETTTLLDLQWDHIVFTGSGTVGKIVAAAAAKHLTPTTLELGGQCPVFFDTHVDMKSATRRLLWARTFNAGQTCTAPNHVFVPVDQQDALVEALKVTYAEFYPNGTTNSDSISHIVTDSHFQRLKDMLEKTNGTIVCGGETDATQRFFAPTIVKDVKVTDALMQSEIFGPILPIIPVKDYREALDFTNAKEHPLALYGFTDDEALKKRILQNTMSGAVLFNECCIHITIPGLPFGGVGTSGYGAYTGRYGFDTFTHHRSSVDNPRWVDKFFGWRLPPYSDSKLKQINGLKQALPAPRPNRTKYANA